MSAVYVVYRLAKFKTSEGHFKYTEHNICGIFNSAEKTKNAIKELASIDKRLRPLNKDIVEKVENDGWLITLEDKSNGDEYRYYAANFELNKLEYLYNI